MQGAKLCAMLATGAALAGCAAAPVAPPTVTVPALATRTGLERVMGHDAAALVQLFGQPEADLREGTARKLQFVGPSCVLDAYLYPKNDRDPKDRAQPLVTHIDARLPDGGPVDRAICIAALSRRR